MDFEEICEVVFISKMQQQYQTMATQVVPWTKFASDCGIDINAEQVGHPRLFKARSRESTYQTEITIVFLPFMNDV